MILFVATQVAAGITMGWKKNSFYTSILDDAERIIEAVEAFDNPDMTTVAENYKKRLQTVETIWDTKKMFDVYIYGELRQLSNFDDGNGRVKNLLDVIESANDRFDPGPVGAGVRAGSYPVK